MVNDGYFISATGKTAVGKIFLYNKYNTKLCYQLNVIHMLTKHYKIS